MGSTGIELLSRTLSKTSSLGDLYQADPMAEQLYYQFADMDTDMKVPVDKFLKALFDSGLRKDDPRLSNFFDNLRKEEKKSGHYQSLRLEKKTFVELIHHSIMLISKGVKREMVIPDFPKFSGTIEELYVTCRENNEGKNADYIPQLARIARTKWGVAVCTIDGQRCSYGDVKDEVCMQSVSKPLNYLIALEDLGQKEVHSFVGKEPSGRIFNEICLNNENKPHNPLINSGAIMTVSLIKRDLPLADRFEYVLSRYKALAGGQYVGFSNSTYLSERDTADRNFALAYYMRENKCFPQNAKLIENLELYFQLCSCEMTVNAAAVVAATLANGGICPITGIKLVNPSSEFAQIASVRDALSLMYSCGMYDYSGQFAFYVGLPAKSGVSGLILLVIPNKMGIALWGPPLDRYGNSCRGVEFCKLLVERYNFHNFDNMRHMQSSKEDPTSLKQEILGLQCVTLLFSAANGDIGALRRSFLEGKDMNQADYDGRTALHQGASEGNLEVVRYLIERCKVKPDPRDRWNRAPLDDAEMFGHEAVAAYLKKITVKLLGSAGGRLGAIGEDDGDEEEEEINIKTSSKRLELGGAGDALHALDRIGDAGAVDDG